MSGRPPRYLGLPATAVALVVLATGIPSASRAQDEDPVALGIVDFPVSCSEATQPAFNRAVALLHHMTYPQARTAFREIAASDPSCAMAHWGVAMTLFQPAWPTRPGPEDLRRGWDEVETARSLAPATERERRWVETAAAFFENPGGTDYWARIRRWEAALEGLHTAFPEDPEAAAFYALAHLAAAPSDAASRAAHGERAAALLVGVYERNPEHPGAMHYLVHANDAQGRERESPEIVRKYDRIAPRNPHALHMPTHIYTRLGDWDAVIDGNLRAAEAALEHPVGETGEYVWDEFPHALEYLVYAYLQRGADDEAEAALARLRSTPNLQPSMKTAFHLASIPARYALERRAWTEAAALVPREPATLEWDRYPWPEGISWFARGLGAAREGENAGAREAVDRLRALEARALEAGEELFTRNLRALRLEVEAWLAHAEGDGESARARMRDAADLETATPKHPVTPGPTLPAHELLGDLLLEQGDAAGALAAYRRSLELYPRRFNSLLGAARAARAAGDHDATRAYYGELLEVAGDGTRAAPVEEARRATGSG